MNTDQNRRKRRRKPTMNGRFNSSSVLLEIGLIRMSLGAEKEVEKLEAKQREKDK